ncbi:hypothetical protein [Rugamonas rubra]|uniref:Uncharacterized protein n=1 Tax=Rugamonas rubra TaxID=758825 RepID=A0A1I4T964_9BURK|nr:hypothetical protein [Rugamonas rubra]SFM73226.1 hypothetical protein SAMN02982985_05107 [Rugamonas rubra]
MPEPKGAADPIDAQSDFEQRLAACAQQLLEPFATIRAVQQVYGARVREQSMQAYGRLTEAHMLLTGVLADAILRVDGKMVEASQVGEERTALFASFVIGMGLCEDAIADGRYLQALTLLRQESETVAQLTLISQGKRKDGEAANVKVLEASLRRIHGDLSAAAHVSKHDVVRSVTRLDVSGLDLPEFTAGARYFPAFDKNLARRAFALHLVLILNVIEHMSTEHEERHAPEDRFGAAERNAVDLAATLMKGEGVVEAD